MGQFANTVFSGLLGWVQAVISGIWRLITGGDVNAGLHWLLENWLPVTLILCVSGLLVDLLIYIIRWQPYRMWGRILHRLSGRHPEDSREAESEEEMQFKRRWVYADGTTTLEDLRNTEKAQAVKEHLELPVRPVRRTAVYDASEKAYYQPVYPPQWQKMTKENSGGNE